MNNLNELKLLKPFFKNTSNNCLNSRFFLSLRTENQQKIYKTINNFRVENILSSVMRNFRAFLKYSIICIINSNCLICDIKLNYNFNWNYNLVYFISMGFSF
jgi:hypothetical protein